MGAAKRLLTFGGGGLLGAAIGAAVATLWAPQSGTELQSRAEALTQRAKAAAADAEAATERHLIAKFRASVNDPDALRDEEPNAVPPQ